MFIAPTNPSQLLFIDVAPQSRYCLKTRSSKFMVY